jgi:protein arginine N-methyltransferase 1
MGIEAALLEVFSDARRRFLKPGGVLIPGRLELHFAPIEASNTYALCERWKTPQHGLDSNAVFEKSIQHFHAVRVDDTELRAESLRGAALDLNAPTAEMVSSDCAWSFKKPTTLHGIAAWFEAELTPGISITNSPLAEHPLNRAAPRTSRAFRASF